MYPAPRWSWRHRPWGVRRHTLPKPFPLWPLLIVAAGDARVDNAKYKAQFHQKAKMMSAEELERFTGLHFGGVCPFAMPAPVQVWLDVSLRRFAEVYPACGSANSAVRLSIPELEKLSKPMGWVDVCKGWA